MRVFAMSDAVRTIVLAAGINFAASGCGGDSASLRNDGSHCSEQLDAGCNAAASYSVAIDFQNVTVVDGIGPCGPDLPPCETKRYLDRLDNSSVQKGSSVPDVCKVNSAAVDAIQALITPNLLELIRTSETRCGLRTDVWRRVTVTYARGASVSGDVTSCSDPGIDAFYRAITSLGCPPS